MFAIFYGLELVYFECNHFILSTPLLQINTCVILYIHQCGNSEPSYDSAIEKFSILIPASAPIAPYIHCTSSLRLLRFASQASKSVYGKKFIPHLEKRAQNVYDDVRSDVSFVAESVWSV